MSTALSRQSLSLRSLSRPEQVSARTRQRMSEGRDQPRGPELLLLALQRLGFLRGDEKLVVLDALRDSDDLCSLSLDDLRRLVGRFISDRAWDPRKLLEEAHADAELLARKGIAYVHFDDPRFPPLLRETARPPFGLYVRGTPPEPGRPCAAVVGTRMPTTEGLAAASELACGLSAESVTVVSGLARGIDSAAHRGALKGPGSTCAVLPCGPDRVYPPANRTLASLILDSGGCLLTEYPPDSEMHRYRFPDRNRIIAGIARACIVVEAPAESGALITAEHALGEGRDLWVHADCLGSARNAGGDSLAAQGAQSLSSATDLLIDWGMAERSAERSKDSDDTFPARTEKAGDDCRRPGGIAGAVESLKRELGLTEGTIRKESMK